MPKKRRASKKYFYQKYQNLITLAIGLLFAAFLYQFEAFHEVLLSMSNWGYIGVFLAGMLSVSSFSAATGVVMILVFAERLNPIEIALIAATGSVVGDTIIFRFVKNGLVDEVRPVFDKYGGNKLNALLHTKYFSWTLPVLGAMIIASPFPDEVGISLLSISKMSNRKFICLSFILNVIGTFLIVSSSVVLKP